MRRFVTGLITVIGVTLLFRFLERHGVKSHGSFLGIPFDFRLPTVQRVRESFWNPSNPRVLTPQLFGWGYSINVPALLQRLPFFR